MEKKQKVKVLGVTKIKKKRKMHLSKYAVGKRKIPRVMKEEKDKGLLSSLWLKTSFRKSPILGKKFLKV